MIIKFRTAFDALAHFCSQADYCEKVLVGGGVQAVQYPQRTKHTPQHLFLRIGQLSRRP